ncbi:hypothetical protein LY78DRAFT_421046 [Colletotrichum sublineola]|nr:hypothetical protein LY78DRAFT_421046 [Colletotrichum sublineola]
MRQAKNGWPNFHSLAMTPSRQPCPSPSPLSAYLTVPTNQRHLHRLPRSRHRRSLRRLYSLSSWNPPVTKADASPLSLASQLHEYPHAVAASLLIWCSVWMSDKLASICLEAGSVKIVRVGVL